MEKMEKKENILGTTPIKKLFFQLAIPSVIAQVVNLLYNMVDRMYIGHIPEIGTVALTGVGVSMPIIMLIAAFATLIGMGGAPRASIAMGEDKYDEAEKILNVSLTAIVILGIILTIVFSIFKEQLLLTFGASEVTVVYGVEYLGIYLIGTIFVMLTLGLNPFISAQGFAKISMYTIIIGAGLNIILDPIFIFLFNMGVGGAATATIISQAVSSFWVIKFLRSEKSYLKINKEELGIEWKYLGPILALGLSPFIMQSTESLLQVVFNTSLAKYGGDLYVGTMTINALIMQFALLPLMGLSQGGTPIISYNYGARDVQRVNDAVKILAKVSFGFTAIVGFITVVFPQLFINLFTKDPELIAATSWTMRVYAAGLFMMGIQVACQQSFIAFGQAKISMFLALLRKIILLIPLIYILPMFIERKVFAVYLAEPISDITAATVTGLMFLRFMKQVNRKLTAEE